MKIIAFAGPARAGKTESGRLVAKEAILSGYTPKFCSFADRMRKAIARLGITKETDPAKYREVMQRWGNSRRTPNPDRPDFGPDYWVRRMERQLEKIKADELRRYSETDDVSLYHETLVIFDDVRFLNEVNMIRQLGGLIIFVNPGSRIDLSEPWRKDVSEWMAMSYLEGETLDGLFDDEIKNTKGLPDLAAKIKRKFAYWTEHAVT